MADKVQPDYVSPEDDEELHKAKAGTGAFKLQNSESYMGEQLSIAERRQRIMEIKMKVRHTNIILQAYGFQNKIKHNLSNNIAKRKDRGV
jgi:hypothetical protein